MRLDADVLVRRAGMLVAAELHAAAGERVVIVGPNGAGKSTLLEALAGVVSLERGRILLGDRILSDTEANVHVDPRHRNVGMVFQGAALFPNLRVMDNVAFGPRARGRSKPVAQERALRELRRVGLERLADARPSALSGGEAQRCALARALATDPDLLLLDEPFAALDVSSRVEVRRAVTRALDEITAPAIIVTHDPVEAMALGDRIVVMEGGRVVQAGSPEEIRARPRSRYVGDLVGLNVLRGSAERNELKLAEGMTFVLAEEIDGESFATFHPHAVALHADRPHGSMRNVWRAEVRHAEAFGDRVRVELDRPQGVAVEVTRASAGEMGLEAGSAVWASLKATEIEAFPA